MQHMNSSFKLIAIQYQLSTLIGQDLDLHKMLTIFVPKMLKIINCIGGYIWLYNKSNYQYEKIYSYPNEIINQSQTILNKIEELNQLGYPLKQTVSEYLGLEHETHSYLLPVGELGFMLLESREIKLSNEMLVAMKPVLKSLATACIACIHYLRVESRYHNVFDFSPVALIEQDYRKLRTYLAKLKESNNDLISYFESNPDEIMKCIKLIKVDNLNRASLDLFSVKNREEFIKNIDKLLVLTKQNQRVIIERLIAISNGAQSFQDEIQFVSLTGKVIETVSKYTGIPGYEDFSHVLYSIFDVTETKHAQDLLAYASTHDVLTGVANRGLYHETLINAVSRARRSDHLMALMYLDLDYFKDVNDNFGHQVGDLVLIEFSQRLQKVVRQEDLVARLGGDEFAVILNGLRSPGEANEVATRLVTILAMPYYVTGEEIIVTVSIGIALCPYHAIDVAELNHQADIALYNAKHSGRNKFFMYTKRLEIR